MSRIIGEAFIFTMGYVLVNIEDTNEGKVTTDLEDVPEFKNIYLDNILCSESKLALKVEGLKEKPIHDIYISNSFIVSDSDFKISLAENIFLKNTKIKTNNEIKYYDNVKLA